ncbi:hypothetical protein [Dechloromonas denitrificans]|uniref:hypothetical protein n=1 Tax=Dechloromonas denitrificans TaxID=281362 RepID=UPI001CF8E141|nr:hypothetical protein [Dechloromonas denitrificans]UCV03743.1 hypothetical protein KI611_00240 [Dechloromonas denitrificans]UCV08006.1 hypothetical protein KI615_00255 [Dechloromonas denitrificans]
MPYIAPDIASKTLEAKALARRNRTKRNVILLIGYLFGISIAVIWDLVAPNSSPKSATKVYLGMMVGPGAAFLFLRVFESRYIAPQARCPKCSYNWEIKEGRGVSLDAHMECWHQCPGCGLLMGDDVLKLALTPSSFEAIVGKSKY